MLDGSIAAGREMTIRHQDGPEPTHREPHGRRISHGHGAPRAEQDHRDGPRFGLGPLGARLIERLDLPPHDFRIPRMQLGFERTCRRGLSRRGSCEHQSKHRHQLLR